MIFTSFFAFTVNVVLVILIFSVIFRNISYSSKPSSWCNEPLIWYPTISLQPNRNTTKCAWPNTMHRWKEVNRLLKWDTFVHYRVFFLHRRLDFEAYHFIIIDHLICVSFGWSDLPLITISFRIEFYNIESNALAINQTQVDRICPTLENNPENNVSINNSTNKVLNYHMSP